MCQVRVAPRVDGISGMRTPDPVRRHERGICNLADREQIAIAKRFRRRQPGKRMGCRTEGGVKFNRLLSDSTRESSSHRSYTFQAWPMVLTSLPITADLASSRTRPICVNRGQPHVQIRQIRRRMDSPCRDCRRRPCLSFPPVVLSRAAMAVAGRVLSMAPVISERIEVRSAAERCRSAACRSSGMSIVVRTLIRRRMMGE